MVIVFYSDIKVKTKLVSHACHVTLYPKAIPLPITLREVVDLILLAIRSFLEKFSIKI